MFNPDDAFDIQSINWITYNLKEMLSSCKHYIQAKSATAKYFNLRLVLDLC